MNPIDIQFAIDQACRAIAPAWPLDRQIAVNPLWGLVDQPFDAVSASLRRLCGRRFTLSPEAYREAWQSDDITLASLRRAISERGIHVTLDAALAALQVQHPVPRALPLPSDALDRNASAADGPPWRDVITQQVSQYCASYFDTQQADWHRGQSGGLYAGWRDALQVDHALAALKQAPEIRAGARNLPDTHEAAIAWSLERLELSPEEAADFLTASLLRINGWGAWCAYLGWQAKLAGTEDPHLVELLAIRCSWEALLIEAAAEAQSPGDSWRKQWQTARTAADGPFAAWEPIWQRALEIRYQDELVMRLGTAASQPAAAEERTVPDAQLVFCIDVRSERFRRAVEAVNPRLETRGFAGFFGLPIEFQSLDGGACRPQLPGLLAPTLRACESSGQVAVDDVLRARRVAAGEREAGLLPFQRTPSGAFTFVECLGLTYGAALLRDHFGSRPSTRSAGPLRPRLEMDDTQGVERKADLLAPILRNMGLTQGFARLLVLVGHGGQSVNNPQAAALDCGACGGQTGEVNARVLAGLLNDNEVRKALREKGIDIPADTVAIGALHDTTTDEVTLFDAEQWPASHRDDLERLIDNLNVAGARTRAERAPGLGLADLAGDPATLLKRLQQRARDWAETRPEWGLANNAAFIAAPRSRTRGVDLEGRSFLHDYHPADDPDGRILEQILTAPMVVAHWINLQYYASTVDPQGFGSGNKLLHNVVCGGIGLFEGNTGDLRIGLSRQSLHDGTRWVHTPLRLSVVLDAPRERIEAILERHATVRQLVDNQWLFLFRYGDDGIEFRQAGRWQPWRAT